MYAVFERLVSNRRPDDDPVRVETCSLRLSTIKIDVLDVLFILFFAISLFLLFLSIYLLFLLSFPPFFLPS